MQAEIFASNVGTGGPYIVVPDQFSLAIFEYLKDKVPCTYPRLGGWLEDRPLNAVMEMIDITPNEVEKHLDVWFQVLSTEPEKYCEGDVANPRTVNWRFDADMYRQAQAKWLKEHPFLQTG